HNLNQATADTQTGQPYLRGNWIGNPYPEDGAPQSGTNYTASTDFGQVPRGGSVHNETGGYQIDQNNNNPNTWTADQFGGLCELCHGNGDGTWTASEIDSINKFGNAANAWVGTNGHSAAVKGGGGSVKQNIFTVTDRNPNGAPTFNNGTDGGSAGQPAMAYTHMSGGKRGYGFRSKDSDGFNNAPTIGNRYAYQKYDWGVNTNTTRDTNVHQFTCSKCHNPHASRLPRLMITNCLDTKHNTWDDTYKVPAGDKNGKNGTAASADNDGKTFSQLTSAQNCHRLGDPGQGGTGSGWNLVTPWTTEGTPDNGTIP
ncbi:MAG: hypothetical protein D6800_10505, partial [Candidatus Zixiibacteriota bacterium]